MSSPPRTTTDPRLASTPEIDAAEAKAAHEAMELFFRILGEELAKLPSRPTMLQALGGTTHMHLAIVDEGEQGMKGVVRYAFVFDDRPEAIREAVAKARRGIG